MVIATLDAAVLDHGSKQEVDAALLQCCGQVVWHSDAYFCSG